MAQQDPSVQERLRLQGAALADFGLFAFRCEDLDRLLHRATELVSEALGVPLVKVIEHLPDRGEMLIRSGVNWQPGVVGCETFGDDEKSPGGYALRADQPVISPDLDHETRFETPDVLRRHGVRSMVNVVIVGERQAFGVLEVDSQEQRGFSEDDVAFLQTYANLLAAAIERFSSHEELRNASREHELLVHELRHRVGNLFGLIQSIASQMSVEDRTAEEFRQALIERLQALAAAEGMVFDDNMERVNAQALARKVLAPHMGRNSARISITGEAFLLPARQARMVGLAIHELATNAAKYGALSVPQGKVRLEWRKETGADAGQLCLCWQETDGVEVRSPKRQGFGTRLLKHALPRELGGEAELAYEKGGFRFILTFPAEPE
ncbi:MAG TPA: GAF domain-containing protein [Devosiaceae bacterium]|jgi:two-component sensor histidine kinase|nr:GAF domain-containing protein [Devosiaceae bacterium]